jgi:TM2 domain-containing membrane protein YozV
LQILLSIITVSLLNRLTDEFVRGRNAAGPVTGGVWLGILTVIVSAMLVGFHFVPHVRRKWSTKKIITVEFGTSVLFFSTTVISFITLCMASVGNELLPPCSPGLMQGKCDTLNFCIVFTFTSICCMGYMVYRNARELFWNDSKPAGM